MRYLLGVGSRLYRAFRGKPDLIDHLDLLNDEEVEARAVVGGGKQALPNRVRQARGHQEPTGATWRAYRVYGH
jgi:hypothetical protein